MTDLSLDEWNCDCEVESPYRTLVELRKSMMRRLGYAAQINHPPPGMSALLNEFLQDAQKQLFLKHTDLRTERFYGWTMTAGQRFYGLLDNEEGPTCAKHLNRYQVSWVGIEDLNGGWSPLIKGISPEMYSNANNYTGVPSRYEIRSCIEIFPAPADAYVLWVKGQFGIESFTADDDRATIDDHLVFLFALGNAKAHYKQADANNVLSQAGSYLVDVKAGLHGTARYIPGTRALAPRMRPTMVEFDE